MTSTPAPIVEDASPAMLARIEASAWGIVCRVGIRVVTLHRLVGLLDRVPHRSSAIAEVHVPDAAHFRGAGACLSRSLARSQFIRMRGGESTVSLGVAGSVAAFDAHAWLEPLDEPDRPAMHRITR
ncbi:MAG: lasso peptide biosynthesis B2 protein [Actinomycetota bacterium]